MTCPIVILRSLKLSQVLSRMEHSYIECFYISKISNMSGCTKLATLIALTLAATAGIGIPDTERKVSSLFELGVQLYI
jgi:hypothetical protein